MPARPVVHAYQVVQIVRVTAEVDVLPGTTGRAAHGAKHRVAVHDPAAYLLGRVTGLSGWDSRSVNRPAIWSTSALVSNTA